MRDPPHLVAAVFFLDAGAICVSKEEPKPSRVTTEGRERLTEQEGEILLRSEVERKCWNNFQKLYHIFVLVLNSLVFVVFFVNAASAGNSLTERGAANV